MTELRTPTERQLLERARSTPLVRPAVEELTRAGQPAAGALEEAIAEGEAHAAAVLAFATLFAGEQLDAASVRALLPDLASTEHMGPLVFAATGEPRDVLLGFLEDGRGDPDREALALLILSDLAGDVPKAALRHARRLARRELSPNAKIALGAAAVRFGDPDLLALAAKDVALAKKSRRVVEEILEAARRAPREGLPEAAGPRIVALDYTVRRKATAGRNDPCPCGSGKKYKKCCALKEEAAGPAASIEDAALHPEQAASLRPAQIARLDSARLAPRTWLAVFDRVLVFREWDVAFRLLGEASVRADLRDKLPDLHLALLHEAYEARDVSIAERIFPALSPEDAAYESLEMACLRREPDLLRRIEQAAEDALRTENDGAAAVELAFVLLRHFPALGIFAGRGAMHERRVEDCNALLDVMEDARDRLLLSPFEPWTDLYERMIDAADERDEELTRTEEQEKLAKALRRARDERRKANTELTKLKTRLDELDAVAKERAEGGPLGAEAAGTRRGKRAPPSAPSPPLPVDAQLEEERQKLRNKVAELRRIVEEGQEERRELRKRLIEAAETAEPGQPANRRGDEDDDVDDDVDDEEGVEAPRNVLVPRFTDRAAKSLSALEPGVADLSLTLVAALASGRPNAWSGTKHLTKVRSVMSARAGIHHRVLFAVDERALVILDVIARRDLEQAVTRLAAER